MSEEAKSIGQVIEIARPQFEKITQGMPLVHRLNYEAEQRFAIQHLQNNSYLMKVARENPSSLQSALCNLAGIGLSLNPALKFAYLIPRNIKIDGNWISRIFAEPGYMGLTQLATDSGSIKWCKAQLVYINDDYTPAKPGDRPEHNYDPFSDRGEIKGVYTVAKTSDGDYLTDEMTITRVNEIRNRTEIFKKAKKENKSPYGPWVTDYAEQVLKTGVRHAYKLWPKTAQAHILAEAVNMSNENMGFEPILTSPSMGEYTAEQKAYFDQLIEKNDALGMHILQQSIEEMEFTNLYHSFPSSNQLTKEQKDAGVQGKGAYQKVVDGLLQKGFSEFTDWVNMAAEAISNGDEVGIQEIKDQVAADAWELILDKAR